MHFFKLTPREQFSINEWIDDIDHVTTMLGKKQNMEMEFHERLFVSEFVYLNLSRFAGRNRCRC